MSQRLFHLVPKSRWESLAPDEIYFPATYEQDGFIHATADAHLLLNVANHFYAGSDQAWLCLETTVKRVEATGVKVLFEPAAAVGETPPEIPGVTADQLFPHLFGGLSQACLVAVHPVTRAADGTFTAIGNLTS
ncbi:MAG: DUF952 domain-containing protein [Pseudomonadota bacterium]